ncbi:cupin domain-containing protein [Candidatus Njordibacter sp. Uisw_002]|jgi:mannose-6-phosphate isomerase-like protein (cupin superfamily)|uniref:cupin domain-containing protein n=1 Tax=Candidatus Njordibacter sp. Uisw_002 TaxID=3230971 RepID=UPI003D38269B
MMEPEVVRYGNLKPCRSAFIDAHTPGSNQKENFTIIGAGVAESPDQHVHIKATPGFNIGAAGQPPGCINSLHFHNTAEVFFILSGKWRFFWGINGDAGEVILQKGDLINIPTRVFRGFENVGTDYAMIMAILGGDDSGGGVEWAPHVLETAKSHGLTLSESGVLYDTKKGQMLPADEQPMAQLSEQQLAQISETPVHQIVPDYVARYWDMMALARDEPCPVIGETSLIKDKPGFEVELLTRGSITCQAYVNPQHEVLMVVCGHWRLTWGNNEVVLNPGDTCWIPPNLSHGLEVCVSGEASLYRISGTDDKAGFTWLRDKK